MKFKIKDKPKNTEWHKVFAWKPRRMENGDYIWLESIYRRYRVHMDSGKYIYSEKLPL